jgi:inhibitor of cysteine peptidase
MVRGRRSVLVRLGIVLVLAAVALAACGGGGSSKKSAALVVSARGGPVSVKKDQAFIIILDSNASTGFTWTPVGKPSSNAVKYIGETTGQQNGKTIGASGKQKFRYRGANAGTATITLLYSRPNQPDAPENTTLTYDVTVK